MKKKYPIRQKESFEVRTPEGVKTINTYTTVKYLHLHEVDLSDDIDEGILDDPELTDNRIYEGIASVLMVYPDGAIPQPIRFGIQADSISEAFDKFDQCAQEEIDSMQKKENNRIITP